VDLGREGAQQKSRLANWYNDIPKERGIKTIIKPQQIANLKRLLWGSHFRKEDKAKDRAGHIQRTGPALKINT